MKLIGGLLVASAIGFASLAPASAAPLGTGDMSLAPGSEVELAQYYGRNRCSTWRRECADLYGWRTRRWHQCMNQPKARRDCGRGYY